MSVQKSSSSSSYGDTDTGTDTSPATTGSSTSSSVIRWAPHGRALTACLIIGNLAVVGLIYLYFWRLFSSKRSAGGDEDEEGVSSSSASTPAPSPLRSQQDQQQSEHDRLVASLPLPFVVRAGAGSEKGEGAAGECAVCIAELREGDEARALPRCGHRFHAACVDAWLRRHTTCPLCRASVAAAAVGTGPKAGAGVTDTTTASAGEDVDAPPV